VGTLIDSSVIVAGERGDVDLDECFAARSDEDFAIAAITASELLHGVHRASRRHRPRREAFVEGILARLPVIAFDVVVARIHAQLWATLAGRGSAVGAHDLLIGATAVSLGYTVATRDRRSFPRIPGVTVQRW